MKEIDGKLMTLDDVVEQYTPLVYKLAGKYSRKKPQLEKEDAVQEAYIAVMRAFENYDESAGVRFMTYLYKTIYYTINRAIHSAATIRLPEHVHASISTKLKGQDNLDVKKIKEALGVEETVAETILLTIQTGRLVSADKSFDLYGKDTLANLVPFSDEAFSKVEFSDFKDVLTEKEQLLLNFLLQGKTVEQFSKSIGQTGASGYRYRIKLQKKFALWYENLYDCPVPDNETARKVSVAHRRDLLPKNGEMENCTACKRKKKIKARGMCQRCYTQMIADEKAKENPNDLPMSGAIGTCVSCGVRKSIRREGKCNLCLKKE